MSHDRNLRNLLAYVLQTRCFGVWLSLFMSKSHESTLSLGQWHIGPSTRGSKPNWEMKKFVPVSLDIWMRRYENLQLVFKLKSRKSFCRKIKLFLVTSIPISVDRTKNTPTQSSTDGSDPPKISVLSVLRSCIQWWDSTSLLLLL